MTKTLGWEPIWRERADQWELRPPEPLVLDLIRRLKDEGARRVHDLGCGLGRHLLLLAAEGFEAYGSDVSPTAVETCERRLREAGLSAAVTRNEMTDNRYANGFFDAVIAWNVVYHATTDGIMKTMTRVRDSLRPGGYLLVTFISTSDGQYERTQALHAEGRAQELEPGTFVIAGDTKTDKALPHHYSTEEEIRRQFLNGFEVVSLEEDRQEDRDFEGMRYPSVHWHALARKGAL
ncbi:MAG: class I SAM-dependent methyltransferase [Dehalococcoidia bacterium]|nr:class I SAM-dependent methyltransferase [Dehalococcoidia bacterium]